MPGTRGNFPYFVIALVSTVLLSGCAASSGTSPSTPSTPTPPQVTAANAVNALAQSLDAAITTMEAATSQGKMSGADLAAAEKVAAIIATAGKQIDAEIKSADPWSTQKTAIVKIITASGIQAAMKNLPANAVTYLAAAITLFDTASSAAGGPTI